MDQAINLLDLIQPNSDNDMKEQCEDENRLSNRYTLGAKLGVGGLSIVYDVKDDYAEYYGDNRVLAVKLPLEHLYKKSDIDAFMYAEYSHLSRLSHPNIVKAVDFGLDTKLNIPYIVMEQLNGRLLSEIPFTELTKTMKWLILKTLFQTINYIHSQNIVHADINPTNIMYLDDSTIKLFDFGISIKTDKKQLFELDYTNIKAYNPHYAAPEVINGFTPNQSSDLFSMAVVLFELYTHKLPYKVDSTELYQKPLSWFDLRHIPIPLKRWFKHTLSPIPEKRSKYIPYYLKLK